MWWPASGNSALQGQLLSPAIQQVPAMCHRAAGLFGIASRCQPAAPFLALDPTARSGPAQYSWDPDGPAEPAVWRRPASSRALASTDLLREHGWCDAALLMRDSGWRRTQQAASAGAPTPFVGSRCDLAQLGYTLAACGGKPVRLDALWQFLQPYWHRAAMAGHQSAPNYKPRFDPEVWLPSGVIRY